jgi:ABC-type dipeptide/oligopeptide/nickel transport system permease component
MRSELTNHWYLLTFGVSCLRNPTPVTYFAGSALPVPLLIALIAAGLAFPASLPVNGLPIFASAAFRFLASVQDLLLTLSLGDGVPHASCS